MTWSIDHTQATETGSLDNLFSNYDVRSPNMDRNAFTSSSHSQASYGSCYGAQCIAPGCTDTKFGLKVNFNRPVFLHALLMVLDSLIGNESSVNSWTIYCIAEDLTETNCGTYDTSGDILGFEAWLNKEVVAFRMEGIPDDSTNWDVKICLVTPFGTSYVHSNPVPPSFSIHQGQQVADLTIDHIKAETGFEITNELAINLRQKNGSELPWATITNDATVAMTVLDLCPPVGNHQLILESID